MREVELTARGRRREAVSVVIPAFNEARRLLPTLTSVVEHLTRTGRDHEVLVVDDGSRDETAEIARRFALTHPAVRVLRRPVNGGKGAAVRHAVEAARKDWVLVTDADLATPIGELDRLLKRAGEGYDVVIGSRRLPGSDIRRAQPLHRRAMGRTFSWLVRQLVLPELVDTQCGFKLYRTTVARELFARQTLDGYCFDVEVLALARQRFAVLEVPVVWSHRGASKVAPLRDSLTMFRDLVRVALRRDGRVRTCPVSAAAAMPASSR